MLDQPLHDLEHWVSYFSGMELPILRKTAARLEETRARIDSVTGREIAAIVLQDPLMAVRVLSYIHPLGGKRLHSEITNIGNALTMQGIFPFFEAFAEPLTIEKTLKDEPRALLGVLHVIRRAQRASRYAHDWAFERHEMDIDEIALAALLHDLPEILLWCFAPKLAIEIAERQRADASLRSFVVQQQVLGIRLTDLQRALCHAWHLPALLTTLMDDAKAQTPRVQNVVLAVNLARHSAKGWDNPALPDDFAAIQKLLRIDGETLAKRLDLPEEIARAYLDGATAR